MVQSESQTGQFCSSWNNRSIHDAWSWWPHLRVQTISGVLLFGTSKPEHKPHDSIANRAKQNYKIIRYQHAESIWNTWTVIWIHSGDDQGMKVWHWQHFSWWKCIPKISILIHINARNIIKYNYNRHICTHKSLLVKHVNVVWVDVSSFVIRSVNPVFGLSCGETT